MNAMEIKAAKALVRADIEQMRERLIREIKMPHAIPQRIVNGSLTEVIAFKESAEKIGKDYHLTAPPRKAFYTQAAGRPPQPDAQAPAMAG